MTADLEQEKCAKCEKTVYEAESLPAGTKFSGSISENQIRNKLLFIAINNGNKS